MPCDQAAGNFNLGEPIGVELPKTEITFGGNGNHELGPAASVQKPEPILPGWTLNQSQREPVPVDAKMARIMAHH